MNWRVTKLTCLMLAMDCRVASALSSSETTPDPTYCQHNTNTRHQVRTFPGQSNTNNNNSNQENLSYSENSISAIQNLDYPIWKSSISISTKVKLPVWFWALGSYQKRCIQDWCPRPVVFAKAVRNQMLPPCVEWWGETDNQAITDRGYCPSAAFLSVWLRVLD